MSIVKHVVNGDAVSLSEELDAILRAKIDAVLSESAALLNEGGHDYIHHVPTDKEADVVKHWDDVRKRESDYDDNEGYSGDSRTFGGKVNFHRHVVHPDRQSAEKYILDKHQKWDGPIAVKYKNKDGKVHHAVGGWAST